MTNENTNGRKLRGWYILYPKELARSFVARIKRAEQCQNRKLEEEPTLPYSFRKTEVGNPSQNSSGSKMFVF